MNVVTLVGNVAREPELKYTQSGKAVCRFTLAVTRDFKRDETDFINCVAWDKTAETIATYAPKGKKIGISGRIQTGSYQNKDGNKVYTTDIIVDRMELLGSKADSVKPDEVELTPIDESDIPF